MDFISTDWQSFLARALEDTINLQLEVGVWLNARVKSLQTSWIELSPVGTPLNPVFAPKQVTYDPANNRLIVFFLGNPPHNPNPPGNGNEVWILTHANGLGGTPEWLRLQPSVCSLARPSIGILWPVNHKLVPIQVLGVTDPDHDPITLTIDSIFQDEPVDAPGSGNTSPDGRGLGTATAEVRAERIGSGNGRVYHIRFTARDGQGGSCSSEVLVGVPKSQGAGAPQDDGPLYNSTIPLRANAADAGTTESLDEGEEVFLPLVVR